MKFITIPVRVNNTLQIVRPRLDVKFPIVDARTCISNGPRIKLGKAIFALWAIVYHEE